jgi:glycosyltransferase involved in cell wall biosynthesis
MMHDLTSLEQPYLLCINIESYRDHDGVRYFGPAWYKDLRLHLRYIKDLRLACPCREGVPPNDAVAFQEDDLFKALQIIDLPTTQGWVDALLKLPVTMVRLWKAIGQASIVHAGIAGWVIPYGWLVAPMVVLRPAKFLLIIVESAPWRLLNPRSAGVIQRFRSTFFETLGRWCVNRADLAIFTQADYKASFLTRTSSQGHVIHASWIDEDVILSASEAERLWQVKLNDPGAPLKIIFAGRVVLEKGILVLLEAMQRLSEAEIPIELTVIGQGDVLKDCHAEGERLQGRTKIKILDPVPYGTQFFELLQCHHAVVVPSLSDEQPRIVYDAYSQALPILGTRTSGLLDCVQDQHNGRLVNSNDAVALANLLEWSQQYRQALARMGMAARLTAQDLTHWKMHQQRWALLAEQVALQKSEIKARK